ncbi:hypothetical protein F0562_006346 [Nyssa sinensis]|uniref:Methyltransferase n=1 Tax=Nyssa sinensis TaxID=561372 RepID=A0A5J5ARD2_9ASTE|nr:hypothetical protein F0562_006346 [Nyssa sinensis]
MGLGKVRNNKRPSGTSYTSTITTMIFIALCVLGVWMLTSNSVVPPQTTTRTATDAATDADATATSAGYSSSTTDSHNTKTINKRDSPAVFEDNPGELPDDAIKSDESSHPEDTNDNKKSQDDQKYTSSDNPKDSTDIESLTGTAIEAESNNNGKQENGAVDNNNKQNGKDNYNDHEDNIIKEASSDVQESSMTQNQQAEETTTQNQSASTNKNSAGQESQETRNDQEGNGKQKVDNHGSLQDTQNQILDEDRQQREKEKQQQQQQHEDQSQKQIQEATSGDRIEQDDAKLHSKTTQVEIQETQQNDSAMKDTSKQETKGKEEKPMEANTNDSLPGGVNSGIPKESKESKKSWKTQADQSENQKERRPGASGGQDGSIYGYTWQLCNVTAGSDYIPCLDNEKALKQLRSTKHYEHRERHCPEEAPTCLVKPPEGYKRSIEWPTSRDKIWYHNVPHTKLAEVKGHQNWVKVTGEFLTFPGGGTQFIHGALHYIEFIQEAVPDIAWGKHTRVILDVGCGVASFGGFLFERDVLAMSFAPKDEHEAQVQFALERGIPAISAVMGTQRLPFPSRVFDLVHCARCRVPWHEEGGALLLELNRVLRPGGYFVWSATPVYQTLEEDVEIWKEMSALTASMCWELVTIKKDKLNSIGAAIYRKPASNECYDQRKQDRPPMCKNDDDPNAAWYVPLQSCMHHLPVDEVERGSRWPEDWAGRLQTPPYWLNKSQMGIYGKPAPDDFAADYEHWKRVVSKSYLSGLGISWENVRNIMDMRAVYGGFAAAMKDLKVWVLNVVNVDSPDTLPIIYERGLFGIYHDWCESFSTYPRTYDLLHADHLFSKLKKRCKLVPVMAEIDRIVRPGGKLIVRDESSTIGEVENLLKSLHWEVHLTFSKNQEGILSAQKSDWRPDSYASSS